LNLTRDQHKQNLSKLKEYRYIDNINDLNYGSFIRCINLKKINNLTLNNGGFVCDIKINNGIEILCRNNYNNFFQFKFDENLIFQKLTEQEKVILNVLKDLN